MIDVSVVISVKNEELNLPICLSALDAFSEVVVVDSGSSDRTREIALQFGCQLIDFSWNGKFPKKRNWTLRNVPLEHDWVLFLDADEFLTEAFIKEVQKAILSQRFVGYWLFYNNHFMGRQLSYGDKMRKLALFRKDAGEYEFIEEDHWSELDMEVHEHPVLNGLVGQIKSPIIHKDYRGLEHYIAKHNAYSTWEAHRFLKLKKQGDQYLNKRQLWKYRLLEKGLLPLFYFLGAYVGKLGFLDGYAGYALAKYKAQYFFQVQTKVREFSRDTPNKISSLNMDKIIVASPTK